MSDDLPSSENSWAGIEDVVQLIECLPSMPEVLRGPRLHPQETSIGNLSMWATEEARSVEIQSHSWVHV